MIDDLEYKLIVSVLTTLTKSSTTAADIMKSMNTRIKNLEELAKVQQNRINDLEAKLFVYEHSTN